MDRGHQSAINIMMVAFMAAHAAVGFGQLDAVAFNLVYRSDMDAVGANDFGMFLDL